MTNHIIKIIFLIVLTFLVYSNIYQNQFISDDISGIVFNNNLHDFPQMVKTFVPYNIIRSFNFQIGKYDPAIYHLTNVLFHSANSVLVYLCVYLLPFWKEKKKAGWIAFLTALLFAIHPIETESVTWISGGIYAVYTFFLLISFLFILYYLQNLKLKPIKKIGILCISRISYGLALLTTLKAIFFPILILALLLVHPDRPIRKIKYILKYKPIIIVLIMVSAFFIATVTSDFQSRVAYMSQFSTARRTQDSQIFQIIIALGYYIKLLFFPINLTLYHTDIISKFVFWIYTGIVAIMGIGIGISIKKAPVIFFSLMWFLITLSPNLAVITLAWTVAERYVYMGSIGIFLFISYCLYEIGEKWKMQEVITGIVLSIIIILIPLTFVRNSEWQNADTFWPKTVEKSPNSAQAHNNMGDYYTRHKNPTEAIKEFTKAIDIENGKYPAAIHNLASVYLNLKETTTAAKLYEKAISQNPGLIESYEQLTRINIQQNNLVKAEEYCQKMIQINPNYAPAYEYLGYIKNLEGDKINAVINLKKALSLNPENELFKKNLDLIQNQ